MADDYLTTRDLFRIYYYDAPPFEGSSKNPISGTSLNFSATPQAAQNRSLIGCLCRSLLIRRAVTLGR